MEQLVPDMLLFSSAQYSTSDHLQVYYFYFPYLSCQHIYYPSPNKSFIKLYRKLGLIKIVSVAGFIAEDLQSAFYHYWVFHLNGSYWLVPSCSQGQAEVSFEGTLDCLSQDSQPLPSSGLINLNSAHKTWC